MTIAYFDCFSGISGNMVLGALLDAGIKVEELRQELRRVPLSGYTLSAQRVQRRGLSGIHVDVDVSDQQPLRHLQEIERIIEESQIPQAVKSRGHAIFRRLGQAEARVHGVSASEVHFHEVGAVDAIVDVMGSVIALRMLDVEAIYGSPLHIGRGTLVCAHGTLPVPAPATLELLRGIPTYGRDVEAELVTPTGAAILTTLAKGFGVAPRMTVEQIGYGAGSRELPHPNLLRVSIGSTDQTAATLDEDTVTVVDTNIDDMNPQWYQHITERVLEAGALDVFLTPIQMKRGRPGAQLSVLVREEHLPTVLSVLFTETTTIGVRLRREHRYKLPREVVRTETDYGPIDVKVARYHGQIVNLAPEYRDCRRAATDHSVPLKSVYQAALVAACRQIERR